MYQQTAAPRWRGFNLLGMFSSDTSACNSMVNYGSKAPQKRCPGYFSEEEFQIIANWGFNFVRLPLSYRVWGSVDDLYRIDEEKLSKLDDAVFWGQKYGLHVNLAMHRAPGYCVNSDEQVEEKRDLWKDREAQDAFAHHWCAIAKRYADVSPRRLTFNLVNEPGGFISGIEYSNVAMRVIDAVRKISPNRTFILDGATWGDVPPVDTVYRELENVMFSCRGYMPRGVTHYGMRKNLEDRFEPKWPGGMESVMGAEKFRAMDRASLDRIYSMWAATGEIYKVGIHCGEFGCANNTPHSVTLAWMEDLLSVLKEHNIGWAMWNLCGSFGVLDSGRKDVEYEDFHGYRLDRKMLSLLQKY